MTGEFSERLFFLRETQKHRNRKENLIITLCSPPGAFQSNHPKQVLCNIQTRTLQLDQLSICFVFFLKQLVPSHSLLSLFITTAVTLNNVCLNWEAVFSLLNAQLIIFSPAYGILQQVWCIFTRRPVWRGRDGITPMFCPRCLHEVATSLISAFANPG